MKKFLGIQSLAAVCLLLLASSAPGAEEELDRLKARYEELSSKLKQDAKTAEEVALTVYGNSLTRARDAIKAEGDLNGLIEANKEIARFQTERTIPDDVGATLPTPIVNLRVAARKARAEKEVENLQKTVDLSKFYVSRLEALKKSLTKEEKIDAALKVDAEIKRMQFIVADGETRLPKPDPTTQPQPPAQPDPVPTPPPKRTVFGKANLIKNGDFEDSKIAPWTIGGWGNAIIAEIDDSSPHAGKGALLFAHESAFDPSMIQQFAAPPGEYVVTLWARVVENTKGVGLTVNSTDTLFELKPGEIPPKFKAWQKFEIDMEVQAPPPSKEKPKPGEKEKPSARLQIHMKGAGKVLIDDVTVTRK